MSDDIVNVRYTVSTDKVGSKCTEVIEYDREWWEQLSSEERDEEMRQHAFSRVGWHWEEV